MGGRRSVFTQYDGDDVAGILEFRIDDEASGRHQLGPIQIIRRGTTAVLGDGAAQGDVVSHGDLSQGGVRGSVYIEAV